MCAGHILQTLGKLSHQCPENWLYYPHWYVWEICRICNWLIIEVASSTNSRIKNPSCICHSSQLVFWWSVGMWKATDAVCLVDAQGGKLLTNHRLLSVCLNPSFPTIGSPSAWGFCHDDLSFSLFRPFLCSWWCKNRTYSSCMNSHLNNFSSFKSIFSFWIQLTFNEEKSPFLWFLIVKYDSHRWQRVVL